MNPTADKPSSSSSSSSIAASVAAAQWSNYTIIYEGAVKYVE